MSSRNTITCFRCGKHCHNSGIDSNWEAKPHWTGKLIPACSLWRYLLARQHTAYSKQLFTPTVFPLSRGCCSQQDSRWTALWVVIKKACHPIIQTSIGGNWKQKYHFKKDATKEVEQLVLKEVVHNSDCPGRAIPCQGQECFQQKYSWVICCHWCMYRSQELRFHCCTTHPTQFGWNQISSHKNKARKHEESQIKDPLNT